MKILLLSNSINGGAGRAAYRLQQGLRSIGSDSRMQVRRRINDDPFVITTSKGFSKFANKLNLTENINAIPFRFSHQNPRHAFSLEWFSDTALRRLDLIQTDVLNLHWVCKGYLSIEAIAKLNKPIVWTLHDMWTFTGGCHYSQDCNRYQKQCGACPQLQSQHEKDLSHWVWRRKAKAWQGLNLTLVSPSSWLAQCVRSSSLAQNLRVEVIPNGIDTEIYRPFDRHIARSRLKLPQDKQLILFGATSPTSDPRKGFHLLQPALQKLASTEWRDRIELVVFGATRPINPPDFGFRSHYLGSFSDDVALSLIYAAADVFVAPSVQDNLPNTVMEAIACGTPCVAFNIGGMPDMIEHQHNGYLATPFVIDDLANGVAWVLEDDDRHHCLSQQARMKVEREFTLEIQARKYSALFEEIA